MTKLRTCAKISFYALLGFCVFARTGLAADPEVEKRLDELEQNYREVVRQLNSPNGSIQSFLGTKAYFGGFLDTGISAIRGPDTKTQMATLNTMIGINLAADISDQLRFVGQIMTTLTSSLSNPHSNPSGPSIGLPATRQISTVLGGGTLPLQGYVEYRASQLFNIRGGLGYVPFGIAYQYYEPVLFRRRGGPQLTRSAGLNDVSFVSLLWTGLHLYGSTPIGQSTMGYNLYSTSPTTNPRAVGGGGRLWWKFSDAVTFGTSFQSARRLNYQAYKTVGADLSVTSEHFGLTAEFARAFFQDYAATTFYAEPYFKFKSGAWLINGVLDFVHQPGAYTVNGTLRSADPYDKWEYGAGLNWLPYATTRFRFTVLQNSYRETKLVAGAKSRNYQSADLSAGISF